MPVLGGNADWIWTHDAGGKLFLGSQHSAVHLSELQALWQTHLDLARSHNSSVAPTWAVILLVKSTLSQCFPRSELPRAPKACEIKLVLNCTNDLEVPNYHETKGLNYLRIAVNDNAARKSGLGGKEAKDAVDSQRCYDIT